MLKLAFYKITILIIAFVFMAGMAGCVSTTEVVKGSIDAQNVRTVPTANGLVSSGNKVDGLDAPDREEILATIDRFFEALATGDARLLELVTSEAAISIATFPEEPGRPTRYSRIAGLLEAMRNGQAAKIEEPYWDPIVMQRKTLAVVWAPYEVWVNERLSHCGIDVFTLTHQKTNWHIDSVHWTQEPSACEELWPQGRSVLRPGMFNKSNK